MLLEGSTCMAQQFCVMLQRWYEMLKICMLAEQYKDKLPGEYEHPVRTLQEYLVGFLLYMVHL
jgi:hypothetical protein